MELHVEGAVDLIEVAEVDSAALLVEALVEVFFPSSFHCNSLCKGSRGGGRGGGRGAPRGRGGRGGGRGGQKGGAKVVIEQHRHPGIFLAKGKEDALVTKNLDVGHSVYGEKRIAGYTDDGESVSMKIPRADVKKVLCSAHKMNMGDNVVVLDGGRS